MPAAKKSTPAPKKKYTNYEQFKNRAEKPNTSAIKAGERLAKMAGTLSGSKPGARTSSANSKSLNAGYISGKKDVAAVKRNQAAKGEFAGVVAKNAARAAKRPGSASAPLRAGVNSSGYNTAFVAAKKDAAASKRSQAKKKK